MMERVRGRRAWLHFCLFTIFLLLRLTAAKDKQPKVVRKQFDADPQNLAYFEDSDVILVETRDDYSGAVHRSSDGGLSWKPIKELKDANINGVVMHPFDNKIAVAAGEGKKLWITKDRAETWTEHRIPDTRFLISFHASDSKKYILTFPDSTAMYTINGFENLEPLREDVKQCVWSKEQPQYSSGDEDQDNVRILCVADGQYSSRPTASRLLISDDFFKTELEAKVENDRPVTGVTALINVKAFTLAARLAEGTDEMALFVTKNTKDWHRAHFGQHKIKEDAYTVMESTNYSLQINVMNETPQAGILFTSNSEGYNFIKNEEAINRQIYGFSDFEKLANVQGVIMTNIVANYRDVVEDPYAEKRLHSKITFDDGRTFRDLKTKGKDLHVHGFTEARNSGRVFSSAAPGLLMAVGNTGEYLRDYSQGDLYVSRDAGQNWERAIDGPQKYEFGDLGAVLLAISDSGDETAEMKYSLDFGDSWKKLSLETDDDKDVKIRPIQLTTTPDSTSLKFVLVAVSGSGSRMKHWIYSIDFEALDLRKCKDKDFEKWHALIDQHDDPVCVMGNTQTFRRRKADAECSVHSEFVDPVPVFENKNCPCTSADFECDFGFVRSNSSDFQTLECVPEYERPLTPPDDACKDADGTFKGPSGIRLIPGNKCLVDDGIDLTREKEWPCRLTRKPSTGRINVEVTRFPGDKFETKLYLDRAEKLSADDETVVVLTNERELFISHDHGKKWDREAKGEEILAIYPNKNSQGSVYFITPSEEVLYSKDWGRNIHSFKAPGRPAWDLQVMHFHPKNENWIIWTTCEGNSHECQPVAHVTTKEGAEWGLLAKSVENCEFAWNEQRGKAAEKLIYCVRRPDESRQGPRALYSSEDFFDTSEKVFEDMLDFAVMSEFIVVAAKSKEEGQGLEVDTSVDGYKFAHARFPHDFNVPHQTAYTVLDSSTHSIFLHVTTNNVPDQEFGSILKSNSNGTSFVTSYHGVNRNKAGYVDFEKMLGLEGVAIINTVENAEEVKSSGKAKKLKSQMTHNDGGEWNYIGPPEKDAEGQKYKCPEGKTIDKCSLNLHGYTERDDPRDTYSSPSAPGVMIGIGNVGEYLGRKKEANTFISRDGGLNWETAKNGQYMWEFGDQGSVIVLVSEKTPTRVVFYSLDEGRTWQEFEFSNEEMEINDITTLPSDNSLNFLLWGHEIGGRGQPVTVNLDFSGLFSRLCKLDRENPDSKESDYELWEPSYENDECIFGQKAQYLRKKSTSTDCYNGPKLDRLHEITETCPCTRRDFECDYNYVRQDDGTCALVAGLSPRDPSDICKSDDAPIEFWDITGYRRIPLSKCEGGKEMDFTGESHPCPGREPEYEKKHGISGAGLFFAITIPIAVALGAGYFVYRRFEGKFGRIQLGNTDGYTSGGLGTSVRNTNWLAIPVVVVSGVATAVMAVPMILGTVWRAMRERIRGGRRRGAGSTYTSRGHFAQRRGEYTAVADSDEQDLLGEESEDEA